MNNENAVQSPRRMAKHAATEAQKPEVNEDMPENIRKRGHIVSIILPLAVLILGVIRSIGNTYERLCPDQSAGRCADFPLAGQVPLISDLALTFGIILMLLALVLIIEMLTWRYKTKIAYVSLAMLTVFIGFTASGAFEFILESIAQNRL